MFDEQCVHGYVYRHGNAPRQATAGYDITGNDIGVPSCGTHICAQRMFDGQQNAARPKAIEKKSSHFSACTFASKRSVESGDPVTHMTALRSRTILGYRHSFGQIVDLTRMKTFTRLFPTCRSLVSGRALTSAVFVGETMAFQITSISCGEAMDVAAWLSVWSAPSEVPEPSF